ncbi:ATP-dependent DNA helicase PIF1-like [Senna tora]|uniref:ATP-dependent DNA helicase PIF1-like n=1 Tax=Senna tora TaxID=362788 RepID=A0A834X6N5_9FABA|nr:ATP-dependent DNA helicase PIF1-like [Senna tora]
MLSLLPDEESTYLSSDNISNQETDSEVANVYTIEFFNAIFGYGLPNHHELKLKGDNFMYGDYAIRFKVAI